MNTVERVSMCYGSKSYANLLNVSGYLDHLWIRSMSFLITVLDTKQFLLRKFLELRWGPQLIKGGTKMLSTCAENLNFLDPLNYLTMNLKRMHKSFDLRARRVITQLSLHGQEFGVCEASYRTQVLWGRLHFR
jgi:hypothetical protein